MSWNLRENSGNLVPQKCGHPVINDSVFLCDVEIINLENQEKPKEMENFRPK